MDLIKSEVSKSLSKILNINEEDIFKDLSIPPDLKLGDISYPCFKIAKELKEKPNIVSKNLSENILSNLDDIIFLSDVKSVGPYLNFYINRKVFFNFMISKIFDKDNDFFKFDNNNKTVIVEFSSPNIAKPIAFHHIRSTVLGNVIANIYKACGYNVKKINYLGDWGTQFGKLITAFEKYGDIEKLKTQGVKHLLDIYVKYHEDSVNDPSMDQCSRNWFNKTENNDEKALEYWNLFKDISLKEFKNVYDRLNIDFDYYEGESFYKNDLKDVAKLIDKKIGLKNSQGAKIIDLENQNLGVVLINKSDGSTLYITRDIAAAIDRWNRFNFDESIYVVAHQQELHFKQFFKILELLAYDWADRCKHVPFGLLQIDDKKMSSREGKLVFLNDVLDKAINLAKKLIEDKNPKLENKDEVAKKVGIGAIVFNDVSRKRIQNINFKWEDVLNFDGDTSPYIQYTYARANSILNKAEFYYQEHYENLEYVLNDEEFDVIKTISCFKQNLSEAKEQLEPFVIARYVLDLCKLFNRYYYKEKILDIENENEKNAKLLIVYSVKTFIKECLKILGIDVVERM